jgi:hypothetical protein
MFFIHRYVVVSFRNVRRGACLSLSCYQYDFNRGGGNMEAIPETALERSNAFGVKGASLDMSVYRDSRSG